MNFKQMLSLIFLSIGIVVMIFAFQQMGQVHEGKKSMSIITNSPITPTERFPERVRSGYTKQVCWSIFLVGFAMALVGGSGAVWYKSREN